MVARQRRSIQRPAPEDDPQRPRLVGLIPWTQNGSSWAKRGFAMATTLRSTGIAILDCMLASTCALGSPGKWTRLATERTIAENSPAQREVLDGLRVRAVPVSRQPAAPSLCVPPASHGPPAISPAAPVLTPGLFPPA